MMTPPDNRWSMRLRFAGAARDIREAGAALAQPNEDTRQAIQRGMMFLATRIQRERFTGQGPFAVEAHRLGVRSGRLRRDIHAPDTVMTGDGYVSRIGASVSYFAVHELGYDGDVMVPGHRRRAYTRRGRRIGETMVRSHRRRLVMPARAPMRTGIEEHAESVVGGELERSLRAQAERQRGGPA